MYHPVSYYSCLALFFLLFAPATCFSWPDKVLSVADGDTITVVHNGQQKEITVRD